MIDESKSKPRLQLILFPFWGRDGIRWNQLHGDKFYRSWDEVWGIPPL